MFKKRWSFGAKGKKKKAKEESDDEGDFGAELEGDEFEPTSSKREMPPPPHKGPNSVTFQLSGPHTFAVVGRNKKIRDELAKIAGAKLGSYSTQFFDLHLLLAEISIRTFLVR